MPAVGVEQGRYSDISSPAPEQKSDEAIVKLGEKIVGGCKLKTKIHMSVELG